MVDLFDLASDRASDVDFALTLVVTGGSCYPSSVAFVDVEDAYLVLTLKDSLKSFVVEVVFQCVVAVMQAVVVEAAAADDLEGNFDLKH